MGAQNVLACAERTTRPLQKGSPRAERRTLQCGGGNIGPTPWAAPRTHGRPRRARVRSSPGSGGGNFGECMSTNLFSQISGNLMECASWGAAITTPNVSWNIACLSNQYQIHQTQRMPSSGQRFKLPLRTFVVVEPTFCRCISPFQHRWSRLQRDFVVICSLFGQHV